MLLCFSLTHTHHGVAQNIIIMRLQNRHCIAVIRILYLDQKDTHTQSDHCREPGFIPGFRKSMNVYHGTILVLHGIIN